MWAVVGSRFGGAIVLRRGYGRESEKVRGFAVGADDYIVKPFSNMELLMRVRRFCGEAAVQKHL